MAVVVWCAVRIIAVSAILVFASALSLRAQAIAERSAFLDAGRAERSAFLNASRAAPSAPDSFDRIFIPAAAAAAVGGGLGYELGLRWRFLGSTDAQAKRREALLLGLIGGTIASGAATLIAADDSHDIVTRKAFTGALTGVVPATALAAAATMPLPDWLQKPVGVLVYGIVQGGVTAWMAGK